MTGTPLLYASAELAKDGSGIYTPNQLHYPDESMIGKEIINPIGMIAAAALMLQYTFGLEEEAAVIRQATERVIAKGYAARDIWQEERMLLKTSEIGQKIIEEVKCL